VDGERAGLAAQVQPRPAAVPVSAGQGAKEVAAGDAGSTQLPSGQASAPDASAAALLGAELARVRTTDGEGSVMLVRRSCLFAP
jgi:hypothetical protein